MEVGWTRTRVVFLVSVAAFVFGVAFWAGRLLLPFILAMLVAYVLTPAVAWCEGRRMPRALSIVVVYVTFLGSATLGTYLMLPALHRELVQLKHELPDVKSWVADIGTRVAAPLNSFIGPSQIPDIPANGEPSPAVLIEPLPNGGYSLVLNGPVDVIAESGSHWQVRPVPKASTDPSRWLDELTESWVDYARKNVGEMVRVGRELASSTLRAVVLTFMMLMCAAYLIHTRDQIFEFFRGLAPQNERARLARLQDRLDKSLSAVVRGQLLICVINGVLSGIGFALLGLKYWPLLTLIATVLSIVPVFGALISSVPAVLVGFSQDPWLALWTVLWIVGIHQLEANFLNPKIIGTVANLHPVLVVFALLLGERSMGIWGAVLALPALSVCHGLFKHFRVEYLDAPPETVTPPKP